MTALNILIAGIINTNHQKISDILRLPGNQLDKGEKKLLKEYPLAVLLYVIHELGEYLLKIMTDNDMDMPEKIVKALTVGGAAIIESGVDFDESKETDIFYTEMPGIS